MDQAQRNARIVYPKLSTALSEEELRGLFAIESNEWAWARTVARRGPWMVALLTHLKIFQHLGRFLAERDLPAVAIAHVAKQIYPDPPIEFGYDRRTIPTPPGHSVKAIEGHSGEMSLNMARTDI